MSLPLSPLPLSPLPLSLAREDAAALLALPAFRRFLHAAIQAAGILGHHAPVGGQGGRDLSFLEGRRSLGFELIAMVHRGQDEALRALDPTGLFTLSAALCAALPSKDTALERPRTASSGTTSSGPDTARYDELPGDESNRSGSREQSRAR